MQTRKEKLYQFTDQNDILAAHQINSSILFRILQVQVVALVTVVEDDISKLVV